MDINLRKKTAKRVLKKLLKYIESQAKGYDSILNNKECSTVEIHRLKSAYEVLNNTLWEYTRLVKEERDRV